MTTEDNGISENIIPKGKDIVPPGLCGDLKDFEKFYTIAKDKPVMILGPSGVGKTFFSKIYETLYREEHGNLKNVARVNCASFTSELLLSEIFGYKKGAFTGAVKDKDGMIQEANSGLLILEEIGELSHEGQAKLLTFLETGKYYRVGDAKEREATTKIIATTNKLNPNGEDFRQDFWFRFLPFYVTPLYQRREDILYYLWYVDPFLIDELRPWEVLLLLAYDWPGNVREIERVARLCRYHGLITAEHHIRDDVENLFHRPLLNMDKRQTELNAFLLWELVGTLRKNGVDVEHCERLLNKGGLGILSNNSKRAFPKFKDEFGRDESIDNRYGVQTLISNEWFKEASIYFFFFCELMMQSTIAARNILKFDNTFVEHLFPKCGLKDLTEQDEKLIRDVRKALLGEEIQEPDLSRYSMDELIKIYLRQVLNSAGGNQVRAAEKAGLNISTFKNLLARKQARPKDQI